MAGRGFLPYEVTISSIIPAVANLGLTMMGKSVHCFWVRHGFGTNVVVETSLVDMYSRFGCISIARYLFDKMPVRNLVSWNVIISGYANSGMSNDAMQLFNLMRRDGLSADYFTLLNLISASSGDNWGRTSIAVHDGFTSGQYWTKAIAHFNERTSVTYVVLDSTAIVSILSSCSSFGALQPGRQIHALIEKEGFSNDVFVGSALIDMYANCGDLVDARKCFGIMEQKDVACWNAMIRAMGANGNGEEAIDLLFRMEGIGVNPNESSLVSALSA
ncbi:hypothetical protein Cgig2_032464 [Carnegiea gigantea]|uniref:Pentatricopeptide repeat-containing protein n=1 Tax=Carnegiea gigantea TaxID=171969 RepID=A0A9Q1QQW5_9CARY|nr:hypothetical protein Cgig2_032464 [Carnegiea gigantea]